MPVSLSRLTDLPWVAPAETHVVLRMAGDKAAAGVPGAMATVLARRGSTPSTPGQKLFLAADGEAAGTVGGGAIEREVLLALMELLEARGEHVTRTFRLGAELGMCCGGSVDVLLEPITALLRA